jgi:hypothetical protein
MTPVAVDAGQEIKGIDFQMQRTATISGTVLNEDQEPLPGARSLSFSEKCAPGKRGCAPSTNR